MAGFLMLLIVAAAAAGFFVNWRAAQVLRNGGVRLHSMTAFHGAYAALIAALPAFIFLLIWLALRDGAIMAIVMSGLPDGAYPADDAGARSLVQSEIRSLADGNVFGTPADYMLVAAERLNSLRWVGDVLMAFGVAAILGFGLWRARRSIAPQFRARQRVEQILSGVMIFCAASAILVTVGITASLVFESLRFFAKVPVTEFLFGLNWEPQIPIREGQVAGAGAFGWVPVILGTLVITAIACAVAIPIGLMTAIYLNEFASPRLRNITKPLLEILAGVPTVVYGFFAILVVAPAMRDFAATIGVAVSPNIALAAGGVMGIMLIPFISSFADDALSAVPRSLRDGSLALGATRGETVRKVLFPAAIPGIVGGVLLAVSRAIGETMIVVMAAGLIATLTINPLDSVTTVTVQIVTLLIGDTSFDNPKTLAAFALGLMLFIVTLGLNIIALRVVRKYREIYD